MTQRACILPYFSLGGIEGEELGFYWGLHSLKTHCLRLWPIPAFSRKPLHLPDKTPNGGTLFFFFYKFLRPYLKTVSSGVRESQIITTPAFFIPILLCLLFAAVLEVNIPIFPLHCLNITGAQHISRPGSGGNSIAPKEARISPSEMRVWGPRVRITRLLLIADRFKPIVFLSSAERGRVKRFRR